jgi:hypothetical protein
MRMTARGIALIATSPRRSASAITRTGHTRIKGSVYTPVEKGKAHALESGS